jgi:hypothetical protein
VHSISNVEARNRCAVSKHVDDWEERLAAFLENGDKKNGGAEKRWRCDFARRGVYLGGRTAK